MSAPTITALITSTMTASLTEPVNGDAPDYTIGHRLRVNLTAQLAALHVFLADARSQGRAEHVARYEAIENDLWDALGNAAQLP